jgi:putative heme-binding domain-containing protein
MGNRSRSAKIAARALAVLFLPLAIYLLSFDRSLGSRASQTQNPQSQIEAGRRIYLGSCGMTYCHAAGGVGGGGPKLRDREFTAEFLTHLISEGVPGTNMPAFKDSLSKQQIAQCVAYILSISEKKGATKAKDDSFDIRGDIEAGRSLFFDSAETQNCRVCHTAQNQGERVGPDLTELAGKPPREILRSIVAPHAAIEDRYVTITITTIAGETFTGVKRDETETMIRLYDTSTLPPVSRAFLKSDVAKTERLNKSAMPADYASKYSFKQLLDLVSFLKSSNVSLKDLF